MHLEIVSPEATFFSGEVTSVAVSGINGEFQMLDHHANIISILTKGDIKVVAPNFATNKNIAVKFTKADDQKYLLSIQSGTLEMRDNKIIILVD